MTNEEKQLKGPKSYVVGTISIDETGCWHCHYIGYHDVMNRKYFGNGVVSFRNIRKMLDIVGSRLAKADRTYTDKIREIEEGKTDGGDITTSNE